MESSDEKDANESEELVWTSNPKPNILEEFASATPSMGANLRPMAINMEELEPILVS